MGEPDEEVTEQDEELAILEILLEGIDRFRDEHAA